MAKSKFEVVLEGEVVFSTDDEAQAHQVASGINGATVEDKK